MSDHALSDKPDDIDAVMSVSDSHTDSDSDSDSDSGLGERQPTSEITEEQSAARRAFRDRLYELTDETENYWEVLSRDMFNAIVKCRTTIRSYRTRFAAIMEEIEASWGEAERWLFQRNHELRDLTGDLIGGGEVHAGGFHVRWRVLDPKAKSEDEDLEVFNYVGPSKGYYYEPAPAVPAPQEVVRPRTRAQVRAELAATQAGSSGSSPHSQQLDSTTSDQQLSPSSPKDDDKESRKRLSSEDSNHVTQAMPASKRMRISSPDFPNPQQDTQQSPSRQPSQVRRIRLHTKKSRAQRHQAQGSKSPDVRHLRTETKNPSVVGSQHDARIDGPSNVPRDSGHLPSDGFAPEHSFSPVPKPNEAISDWVVDGYSSNPAQHTRSQTFAKQSTNNPDHYNDYDPPFNPNALPPFLRNGKNGTSGGRSTSVGTGELVRQASRSSSPKLQPNKATKASTASRATGKKGSVLTGRINKSKKSATSERTNATIKMKSAADAKYFVFHHDHATLGDHHYVLRCPKQKCPSAKFCKHPLEDDRAVNHFTACGVDFEDEEDIIERYAKIVEPAVPGDVVPEEWVNRMNARLENYDRA